MHYRGSQFFLRPYVLEDADAISDLMVRNRDLFDPFTPTRNESYYTAAEQRKNIELWTQAREADERYSFGIFAAATDQLIGDISLFEVARGPLQKCMLGYCLDMKYNGKGIVSEAVRVIVNFAFEEAGFHRIEAGVQPRNKGSIRVLEKAGFQREGLARKNVKIHGEWQDHYIYAILEEDILK
ncbi:GNAT family N-acetyltransferase [Paenibacillus sp. FJAT-26967]|uniref:GNAT family N-acetyltransferase n=1 Tax=Paenibacillus sp. FJAT-26967 TaxID=1729690 RepID=UPI000838F8A0|nr:GNAT family protein [Paenibacillus sp. FJAT-26967]